MRKFIGMVFVGVLLTVGAFGQSAGVVAEAKAKIAQQRHEKMVGQAKYYLEEKERLEAELTKVNEKLAKLDRGELVSTPSEDNTWVAVGGTAGGYYYTTGGTSTTWTYPCQCKIQ